MSVRIYISLAVRDVMLQNMSIITWKQDIISIIDVILTSLLRSHKAISKYLNVSQAIPVEFIYAHVRVRFVSKNCILQKSKKVIFNFYFLLIFQTYPSHGWVTGKNVGFLSCSHTHFNLLLGTQKKYINDLN